MVYDMSWGIIEEGAWRGSTWRSCEARSEWIQYRQAMNGKYQQFSTSFKR